MASSLMRFRESRLPPAPQDGNRFEKLAAGGVVMGSHGGPSIHRTVQVSRSERISRMGPEGSQKNPRGWAVAFLIRVRSVPNRRRNESRRGKLGACATPGHATLETGASGCSSPGACGLAGAVLGVGGCFACAGSFSGGCGLPWLVLGVGGCCCAGGDSGVDEGTSVSLGSASGSRASAARRSFCVRRSCFKKLRYFRVRRAS